jgi:NADH-quinone oxidoreductase subunit C
MEEKAIYELLAKRLEDAELVWQESGPETFALVPAARIHDAALFLREDPRLAFDFLMCLSGIDWDGYDENGKGKSVDILGYNQDGTPETSDRVAEGDLGVAYHLYSYRHGHKFAMQARLPRNSPTVPTVSDVWPTADWHEREAWDLLGVRFAGHHDLRRILLDEGWEGHPLRKDYQMPARWSEVPLTGQPYSKNPYKQDDAPAGTGGDDSGEG